MRTSIQCGNRYEGSLSFVIPTGVQQSGEISICFSFHPSEHRRVTGLAIETEENADPAAPVRMTIMARQDDQYDRPG